MKKILEYLYIVLLSIFITLFSPILIWYVFYRFGKVEKLLDYGRLGIFVGDVRVETKKDSVLWQGKSYKAPKAILSMNVYSFWAEGNTIVIKVYRNDKKIEKLNKELSNKEDKLK